MYLSYIDKFQELEKMYKYNFVRCVSVMLRNSQENTAFVSVSQLSAPASKFLRELVRRKGLFQLMILDHFPLSKLLWTCDTTVHHSEEHKAKEVCSQGTKRKT